MAVVIWCRKKKNGGGGLDSPSEIDIGFGGGVVVASRCFPVKLWGRRR